MSIIWYNYNINLHITKISNLLLIIRLDLMQINQIANKAGQEQTLDSQKDALRQAGCERIFEDKISGIKVNKREF